ncbi:hypothetical protein QYE76_010862 [Lolium multiflorum]|uniref:Arabidopsis retrotransposon Orf1 C-terminal domain-containing protein n=1 Tax=Lolium multiflorum TaxID=4521 RepID=A0AAD8TUD8_LOLMU|nr:hypothetical protein QYE76_010862 [Lolium multiflorum]
MRDQEEKRTELLKTVALADDGTAGYVRTTCPYRTINIMDEFCQISREFNGHCAMSFFRKSSSGGVDGSSSQHDPRKKARKGKEVLETDFDEEYNRLYGRKVLPTKWVNSGFLTSNGLASDFTMMVRNAVMEVFSALNYDTYKRSTLEFLATFHDDLATLGRHTTNLTIHYFATFLANSRFAKGDTGAMASPEMSVICSTLYPYMVHKMNLDALLIHHFRR